MEIYDFRCVDVHNMSFPNFCHSQYDNTMWKKSTDRVDLFFVHQSEGKICVQSKIFMVTLDDVWSWVVRYLRKQFKKGQVKAEIVRRGEGPV